MVWILKYQKYRNACFRRCLLVYLWHRSIFSFYARTYAKCMFIAWKSRLKSLSQKPSMLRLELQVEVEEKS